jgi:DNA modification methylase
LGFYSFCNSNKINGRYIGNEPADQTYNDLLSLKLKIENSNFHCDLLKYGSEESLPIQDGTVDLAFTSPPYFDKEKYFKEESQCWKKYSNIKLWEMQYLIPTIQNAFRILKPEGKLIININKDLADLVNKCALGAGFQFEEEMKLGIGRDHFSKKKGDTEKAYEPILVFKKG